MKKEKIIFFIDKLLIIFFIGAIIGFLYEVVFYYFTENRLDNAGILYGPWLPIYGTGAILISLTGPKLKKHPIILFLTIIFITGLLEYIIGYIDLHVFNKRFWDYRGLFLNIDGFVCLRSVLTFAIGGLFLVYIIEPRLNKIMQNKRYYKLIHNIVLILLVLFISDFVISKYLNRTPYLYLNTHFF